MNTIDHSNYEAWLLDRLEGNLTAAQERALSAFLALHPELDPGSGTLPTVSATGVGMDRALKAALKQQLPPTGMPGEVPLDDLLIARLEGDLSTEQESALALHLGEHPEHQRSERLYALTKIAAPALSYPAKGDLKKGGRVIPLYTWAARFAAAASLTLLIGAGLWLLTQNGPGTRELAERERLFPTPKEVPAAVVPATTAPQQNIAVATPATTATEVEGSSRSRSERPVQTTVDHSTTVREVPPTLVAQRAVRVERSSERLRPISVEVPVIHDLPNDAPVAELPQTSPHPIGSSLAGAVAAELRERVLARPDRDTRPLDGSDAIAAVDLGLRTLGGSNAGLEVSEQAKGKRRLVDLKLGRNLTITASTAR